MRIVVTGGLGFIGTRVARRLAGRGHDLLLIDLPRFGPIDPAGLLDPSTEVAFHDLLEIEDWEDLLRGADVVVHSAAIHQVDELSGSPIRALEVNVGATRRLLESCERAGVRRVVYLSSAKVYGMVDHPSSETDLVMPVEPYGLSKVVGEGYCDHFRRKGSLEASSVRPFSVYGPDQPINTGYIGALIGTLQTSNRLVLPGEPTFRRDFVHVETVVDVVAAAIEADQELPHLINAGSGQPTSLSELVGLFESITGRRLDVTFVDPRPGTLQRTLCNPKVMNGFASPRIVELEAGLTETINAHIEQT